MAYKNDNGSQIDCLRIVYGDVVLGVHGEGFDYLFSYAAGGMESLCIRGKEWLYRTPKPTFWRAVTDNDRGNGFPFCSSMWLGADMFIKTGKTEVWTDHKLVEGISAPCNNQFVSSQSAEEIKIRFTYQTATTPHTQVEVCYTINRHGRIRVQVKYHGKKGLPQLPVFGMRFIMPTAADSYVYKGLSGETYPDRMAGGVRGVYEIKGLPVTPYLVPQDCGVHMDTETLTITRSSVLANESKNKEAFSIRFSMDKSPFAFSCLPYTAQELENALHQEELPPPRRTVVSILGAVRGVGGIDSWGSDVESAYHIDGEKDIDYSFFMDPL